MRLKKRLEPGEIKMYRPTLVQAPSERVVAAIDAAKHCRADDVTEDLALITALALAAEQHFDGWSGVLGRCLVDQQWQINSNAWPRSNLIRLPFPDVKQPVVTYRDGNDLDQTIPAEEYELLEDARGAVLRFGSGFTAPPVICDRGDAVTVSFVAGYGAASAVPQPIKTAIVMLVAHWYEHREAASPGQTVESVPMAVDLLTSPYRRTRL